MATYRTVQESPLSPIFSGLTCDICGSTDIVDAKGGYVCRECGIVLEIQKLQYDRPYNEDIIQYAKGLGITQIGTKRERGISPNSLKLQRLNKHNSIIDNENTVSNRTRVEISRIFNCLGLADYNWLKEMVFHKFKEIRPKLRYGNKYRNPEKLVSIIIYFCLKLQNISINSLTLMDVSSLSKKEFNDFIFQIQRFIPMYAKRNRQEYILQRVLEVTEHFKLGMSFYFYAKKILFKLWEGIKNTTDNIIAGLISSITVLCSYKDKIRVSAICDRLGIRMSTIQHQVKKRIFEEFKIEGFASLVRSADLLYTFIENLGLFGKQAKEQELVITVDKGEQQGVDRLNTREKAFNMTDDDLKNIKNNDALKLKLCNENGVILLQIPDDEIIPSNKMQEYIENEYERKTGKTLSILFLSTLFHITFFILFPGPSISSSCTHYISTPN